MNSNEYKANSNRSDSFLSIISPYISELRAYCHYLTQSAWDSEDLYQETLLKSYVHYLQTGSFTGIRAFLYKVARNIWIDDYRKRRRRMVNGDVICIQASYEDVYHTNTREMVEWLNDRLPKRSMEMFMLAEMFDYSNQEIADELASTVPAVKCVLHRTRRMIRASNVKIKKNNKNLQARNKVVDYWVQAIALGFIQKA